MKYRELLKRILREKPQRKIRLTHSQSLHSDSSNSSTLTLSIVISLRGSLIKTFFTIPISVRRLFGVLGSSQEVTNSHWLMLWFIAESGKLKKTKVRRNLVGVGTWRVQVHWIDQVWWVFYYSCILTTFFTGLFTVQRVAERFYIEGFGFLFDNTSLCCPCVCISLLLIFTI